VFCPKTADIKFMSGHKDIANYGDIYDKLETVYQRDGGQCTVDSAFGNVNLEFFYQIVTGDDPHSKLLCSKCHM